MLWMVQRVFFGPLNNPENQNLKDLNLREMVVLMPLIVMIFWMGLYPKTFFVKLEPSVDFVIKQVNQQKGLHDLQSVP